MLVATVTSHDITCDNICNDCNNPDVYVNLVIDVFVLYTILNTEQY